MTTKRKSVSFNVPDSDHSCVSKKSKTFTIRDLPISNNPRLFDFEFYWHNSRSTYKVPFWLVNSSIYELAAYILNNTRRRLLLKRLQLKYLEERKLFEDKKQKWVQEYWINQPAKDELRNNFFVEKSKWEEQYEKDHIEPYYTMRLLMEEDISTHF